MDAMHEGSPTVVPANKGITVLVLELPIHVLFRAFEGNVHVPIQARECPCKKKKKKKKRKEKRHGRTKESIHISSRQFIESIPRAIRERVDVIHSVICPFLSEFNPIVLHLSRDQRRTRWAPWIVKATRLRFLRREPRTHLDSPPPS
jgi:hypothetical protein